MKALLIYSFKAGINKSVKYRNLIIKKLSTKYEVDDFCYQSDEELKALVKKSLDYETVVVSGGDGSFNRFLNEFAPLDNKPIIGYVPTGTLNDAGKSLGIKNLKSGLKTILRGNVKMVDVMKMNDRYFMYSAALGAYSDIPYVVKRKRKQEFGHFAYYFEAIKQVFKKQKYHFEVEVDGNKLSVDTPFMLLLNGKYMGGFKIDKSNDIGDGKFSLMFSKPSIFNGLFNYLVFKRKVTRIVTDRAVIRSKSDMPWCLDGDASSLHDVTVTCLEKNIRIFGK